jgi:hypothetical protein
MRQIGLAVVAVAVAACCFPPAPALAKEGVRAHLDKPVRLAAKPGSRIRVAWHLVDRRGQHFGAGGIYLRVSRCGRDPLVIRATEVGDGYYARFTVPRGGIRKLLVGLIGWQFRRGHKPKRADVFFQFSPPLHRDCD